jgi:hypothetical protein
MRQGSLIAMALGALLLTVPAAEARVYDDPCPRQGSSEINRPDGTILMCAGVEVIGAQETVRLNKNYAGGPPAVACRPNWKLGGTTASYRDPLTAHWDYATQTAWVSWTGSGIQEGVPAFVAYKPLVRNWWLTDVAERVRYIQSCERISERRGSFDPGADEGVAVTGDAGPNDFEGTPEDDKFAGDGGDDELAGDAGDDEQYAGAGDDEARGGSGDDEILSGAGDDSASGGAGSDSLFDDQGNDDLRGGAAGDRFSAHDRTRDRIDCGSGEDVVVGDDRDRIAPDCEHVFTSRRDAPKNPPA